MVVFTNGCFDVLHAGHIDLLKRARALGDKLIVGINSDRSVRAIKGNDRPLQDEASRQAVLLALEAVDEVVIFDEPTPAALIESIRPDVLVKGGDWPVSEIVGADLVHSYGGKVYSLPLVDGLSSSSIIEKIRTGEKIAAETSRTSDPIAEHIQVMQQVSDECWSAINECEALIWETLERGGKILICGNGGSAADAQHLAAEFVGRFETERAGLPAIALTTDTSALTALSNDYGFEHIFRRQMEALAREGDCLIAISTSGTSPNVIAAVMKAREIGCRVVGMTGIDGRKLAALSDAAIMVPARRTARIQEAHITVAHVWCEMIDRRLSESQALTQ